MSNWPSAKAGSVLRALRRIGWEVKRQASSHRTLSRPVCLAMRESILGPISSPSWKAKV